MTVHRFSVSVNCSFPYCGRITEGEDQSDHVYADHGSILLPDSYSDRGEATRLVISCHGAGGGVSDRDSHMEKQDLTLYLAANGYAVMDVNGLPAEYAAAEGIDIRNNIGSPIAIQSYIKAYHYCIERFNLKREVFVHGASMGGISSTNLVLSEAVPVIAHSAFCPVLDTYNEIFLHPWSGGLPKTAMGRIYRLDTDEDGNYIYDEARLSGCNPVRNPKIDSYPVPVKLWHCVDDPIVSYRITRGFVERINGSGGEAQLCSLPRGGHEPQLAGEEVAAPTGITRLGDITVKVRQAVEDAFLWISSHNPSI